MTDKLPPVRASGAGGCPARHGMLTPADGRVAGATAAPPVAVAPPMVSAAHSPPTEAATPPLAVPPAVAALATFATLATCEGQVVFRILPPGSAAFRAGDVFRFAHGSRGSRARLP